jgi:hypothetical protein
MPSPITLTNATKICRENWPHFSSILHLLRPGLLCLRLRPLGPQDHIVLDPVLQQGKIQLAKIMLARDRSRHPVGYSLLYQGTPILHHATGYCAIHYSPPLEQKFREPTVQYNDPFVRVLRFGADPYDWFICSRGKTKTQTDLNQAAAAQQRHVGGWRDGA